MKDDILKNITPLQMGEAQWRKHEYLFEEKPPLITGFLDDPYFLGSDEIGLKGEHYPIWRNALKKLHPHPFLPKYNECITSGAIGIGKTFGLATLSGLYVLCFHLCMKAPQAFYEGLNINTTLGMKLFSSNLAKAEDVNWKDIENIIKHSPFFRKYVLDNNSKSSKEISLRGKKFEFQKNIKIEIASTIEHAQGEAIIVLIHDEAAGKRAKDKNPNQAYMDLVARRKSRLLMPGERVGGMLHLLGEAEGEDSFLEIRKEDIKASGSKQTMIIENISQWEAKKHLGLFNSQGIPNLIDKTFKVFLGNKTQDPFLVENLDEIKNIEGEVIDIPIAYKPEFEIKLLHSIKKYAGRANSRSSKLFKNKSLVYNTFIMPNWFTQDEIILQFYNEKGEIDTEQTIMDFIKDINKFKNPVDPFLYRFTHIDVARTKDRLSASTFYSEFKNTEFYRNPEGVNSMTDKVFKGEWTLTIRAKQGQEIPLNKVVQFFALIKTLGYPIHLVTTDQKEGSGAYLRQEIRRQGFRCEYLSVDTSVVPYETLLAIMLHGSIVGVKSEIGVFELINLNHYGDYIDHDSDKSKDVSDGIAGAVYSCFSSEETYNPALLRESIENSQSNDIFSRMDDNLLDSFLDRFM
jgi:hypothetical protein